MSVAVVSGTGFLGRAVMRQLAAKDIPAVAIARGMTTPDNVPFERADRMDRMALQAIFRAHRVNAVIDIYALTLANSAPVIAAAAYQGARYVLVSSVDVYGNYEGLIRKGSPPIHAAPSPEDAPLRQMRFPYRGNPNRPAGVDAALFNDYDKLLIEEALRLDHRMPHAILRPPMIFGRGDPQGRFAWIIKAIQQAKQGGTIRLDARAAGWLNSYAHIDDVASALVLLALDPRAEGQAWNIAYPDTHPQRWWLEQALRHAGLEIPIEESPPEEQGLLSARAEAMDLRYPLTLDSQRIRRKLEYTEQSSDMEAFFRTIDLDIAKRNSH